MQEKNKKQIKIEDEQFRKAFASEMKRQRERLGMTQKKIAEKAGIPIRQYISMENGSMTSLNLFRYLKLFHSYLEYPFKKNLPKT